MDRHPNHGASARPPNQGERIAPGPVFKSLGQSQADFERECRSTPLQHAVGAEDVTAAIRFLLDTRSITGQMIALDAGQHLAWDGRGE